MRRVVLAGLATLALTPASALATVHLMAIQEVFVGPPGDESQPGLMANQRAQYVMLRMTSSGQNLTNATFIRVEDADGNLVGRFGTFTKNMANAGSFGCAYPSCPAILIGTQRADDLFTFTFDQIVDAQAGRVALPPSGGRVCFVDTAGGTVYDCVAWGNFDCSRSGNCPVANGLRVGDFAGNACDTNFGLPAAATGLIFGRSLTRTSFNCASKENSSQFTINVPTAFPNPVNNGGQNDNSDTDGDGLINQLDCDDASSQNWWAGVEVGLLMLSGANPTSLSWPSQALTAGPGATYDLVRGTLGRIASFTDANCLAPNTAETSAMDAAVPPAKDGFYYDVRAGAGPGCAGPYAAGRGALDPLCP